jgi:hypothetical protein
VQRVQDSGDERRIGCVSCGRCLRGDVEGRVVSAAGSAR